VTFDDFLCWDRSNFLVTGSTPGTDTLTEGGGGRPSTRQAGLVPGHAYSIIAAVRVQRGRYGGAEVLKVRNPWGEFEWGGAWSDHSPQLADADVRDELGEEAVAIGNDGVFWISFVDLKAHFVSVDVCMAHVPPRGASFLALPGSLGPGGRRYVPPAKEPSPSPWPPSLRRCAKTFFAPIAEGAPLRAAHAFALRVTAPPEAAPTERVLCELMLHQYDERVPAAPSYLGLGLAVFRVDPSGRAPPQLVPSGSCPRLIQRDRLLEVSLEPGEYVCVPMTSGVRAVGSGGASGGGGGGGGNGNGRRASWDGGGGGGDPLQPDEYGLLGSLAIHAMELGLFALDFNLDGRLDATDLQQPAARRFVEAAQIDTGADPAAPLQPGKAFKMAKYPHGVTGKLLRFVLFEAWRDRPDALLRWRRLYASLGFDPLTLQPRDGHVLLPVVLTTHSVAPVDVSAVPFPPALHEWATGEVVRSLGRRVPVTATATLYCLQRGEEVGFAAENSHQSQPVELTLDCGASLNVRSDRPHSALKASVVVPPARHGPATALAMSLLPRDQFAAWRFQYRYSTRPLPVDGRPALDAAAEMRLALGQGRLVAPPPPPLEGTSVSGLGLLTDAGSVVGSIFGGGNGGGDNGANWEGEDGVVSINDAPDAAAKPKTSIVGSLFGGAFGGGGAPEVVVEVGEETAAPVAAPAVTPAWVASADTEAGEYDDAVTKLQAAQRGRAERVEHERRSRLVRAASTLEPKREDRDGNAEQHIQLKQPRAAPPQPQDPAAVELDDADGDTKVAPKGSGTAEAIKESGLCFWCASPRK